MSEYDFEFRKLYDQNAKIEEGGFVCSRMYAISYMYPGAISRTTARCRMSLVYQYDDLGLIINGGNIEKWTDRGWMSVDEFFDAHVMFPDLENAFAYMLNMFKSFTLGIPVGLEGSRDPEPSPRTPPPGKKPKLREGLNNSN